MEDSNEEGIPVSHLQVSATLLKALSQHGDHVFVVVQQLLHQFTETRLLVLILDLQEETGAYYSQLQNKSIAISESDVLQLKCFSSFLRFDTVVFPQ